MPYFLQKNNSLFYQMKLGSIVSGFSSLFANTKCAGVPYTNMLAHS